MEYLLNVTIASLRIIVLDGWGIELHPVFHHGSDILHIDHETDSRYSEQFLQGDPSYIDSNGCETYAVEIYHVGLLFSMLEINVHPKVHRFVPFCHELHEWKEGEQVKGEMLRTLFVIEIQFNLTAQFFLQRSAMCSLP